MKVLISLLLLTILVSSTQAGEFSKIDQTVRETIIDAFNKDREGNIIYDIDYHNDIWDLDIRAYDTDYCMAEVFSYANIPGKWGPAMSHVMVCINKNSRGEYEGEILDYELI